MFQVVLILLGISLRLSHYIYNRSLWTDEAWVAEDVLSRSFREFLFNDISHVHLPAILPAGFLIIEKTLVVLLGNSEYVLRLFPFTCGIAALIAYWILLKKWTNPKASIIALSFFVFTVSLIDYSSQCKQYSVEVLVSILLYLAAIYFYYRSASFARNIIFGIIGMAGMFISHTAVFILAGIAIAQILFFYNSQERKTKKGYLLTYLLWAVFFILVYFVYLRGMLTQNSAMGEFCLNTASMHMMPSSGIFSLMAMEWLWSSILGFFQNPLGLSFLFLALGMFILGAIGIFSSDKKKFLMLTLPLILTILASVLRKFPFYDRFVLFLLPSALIFISNGLSMIMSRGKVGLFLGVIIFIILIGQPLKNSIDQEINPQGREEIRPIMAVLLKDQFPGDSIYMNNSVQYAYSYYLKYFHADLSPYKKGYFMDGSQLDKISLVLSTSHSKDGYFIKTHMYRKKGFLKNGEYRFKQRTWLILSHLYDPETEQFIKNCFDDRGKMLLVFKKPGASLYLYELYEPLTQVLE